MSGYFLQQLTDPRVVVGMCCGHLLEGGAPGGVVDPGLHLFGSRVEIKHSRA